MFGCRPAKKLDEDEDDDAEKEREADAPATEYFVKWKALPYSEATW